MTTILQNIRANDLVKFEVNGTTHNVLNRVVKVTDSDVFVQVNNAGSLLHGSLLKFNKQINEVRVKCFGTAIYKISN